MREIRLTRRFRERPMNAEDFTIYPVNVLIAEEDELIDFANTIREAGGANVIDALMPSNPGLSQSCLIANALNFSASVDASLSSTKLPWHTQPLSRRGLVWKMFLPPNMGDERARQLGRATRCYVDTTYGGELWLPVHIGNAAHAFDSGDAYQEYLPKKGVPVKPY